MESYEIQHKKLGPKSEIRFGTSIRRYLCLKLQKVDKGDGTRCWILLSN